MWGKHVPLETLEELGTLVVSPVPSFSPNWALMPFLQGLERVLSPVITLSLGCQDPSFRHIQSFHHPVTIQLTAEGGGPLWLHGKGGEVLLMPGTRTPPLRVPPQLATGGTAAPAKERDATTTSTPASSPPCKFRGPHATATSGVPKNTCSYHPTISPS